MGLDVNELRIEKGGDPDRLKESCRKRGKDPKKVDQLVEIDKAWRKAKFDLDHLRKDWNAINTNVGVMMKAAKDSPDKPDTSKQIKMLQENEQKQKMVGEIETKLLKDLQTGLHQIGNIVHHSVPDSANEKDNEIVKKWGEPKHIKINRTPGFCHHHEILHMIGGYEPRRGQRLAGHRGYFLTGVGALLNLALLNYGVSFLTQRKYTAIQPPFFMKKDAMAKTSQLNDFDEQLYKVETGKQENSYLIATSEQPLSCLHMHESIEEKTLPLRYAGISTCFRKEAGAHGKDAWGIFRVHQFEKIEQFVLTTPEESWNTHQEMIRTAEQFYQSLELPYQVVNIVSGELNDAAAKKYDLEAWFPGYGQGGCYRELVSCSNCTDYQSRPLQIRCGLKNQGKNAKKGKEEKKPKKEKKDQKKEEQKVQETKEETKEEPKKEEEKKTIHEKRYVHMLNATLCATERTLCCILQNFQTPEGVIVPKVLQPYMGNLQILPYVQGLPKKDELGKEPVD